GLGSVQAGSGAGQTIFVATKSFPKEETYSLTDQVRRCSRCQCYDRRSLGKAAIRYGLCEQAERSPRRGDGNPVLVGPRFSLLLLQRLQCLFGTWFVRVGQLHGLFGGGDGLGLATGSDQHLRERQVSFPLLRPAVDASAGAGLGFRKL